MSRSVRLVLKPLRMSLQGGAEPVETVFAVVL